MNPEFGFVQEPVLKGVGLLVECVPNFSDGRNQESIRAIAQAIQSVKQVSFLGHDASVSANRTVMTFAGPPSQVAEAAFRAIEAARTVIDMRTQQGVHPRIGATDVCPLIPLHGISMEDTVLLSKRLARRVSEELGIPTYLYGKAAANADRTHLSDLRKGGYESLFKRDNEQRHLPDFGSLKNSQRAGATVIGVRDLMIAYNINLSHATLKQAKLIARHIRESGTPSKKGHSPGLFKGLKAIGWYLPDMDCVQVSTNIMAIGSAPPHLVYQKVEEFCNNLGIAIAGSELIGLMPRQALQDAGRFFQKLNRYKDLPTHTAAIVGLGLNSIKSFNLQKHILENSLNLEENFSIQSNLELSNMSSESCLA